MYNFMIPWALQSRKILNFVTSITLQIDFSRWSLDLSCNCFVDIDIAKCVGICKAFWKYTTIFWQHFKFHDFFNSEELWSICDLVIKWENISNEHFGHYLCVLQMKSLTKILCWSQIHVKFVLKKCSENVPF